MSRRWLSALTRIASTLEDGIDLVRHEVRIRVIGYTELRVAVYRSYGTATSLRVLGRVLRDAPIVPAAEGASAWDNFVNTYRRFETDEVPGALLRLRCGEVTTETAANPEGYFDATMELPHPLESARDWHDVDVELIAPTVEKPVSATAEVLVPPTTARFGVISDIDDTVIRTEATDLLRMARHILLGNARTRLPFPGVSAFYRALRDGLGEERNPVFYVSSSPWNLYELLLEFFELHDLPAGPLMLRDWGLSAQELLPTKHGPHKRAAIAQILERYPTMPFVLIGDSGQEDPEIYAEAIREHPGRVLAAYIRNVSASSPRSDAIRALARELAATGGALLLADDTTSAARDAAERGLITPAALDTLEREMRAERDAPPV